MQLLFLQGQVAVFGALFDSESHFLNYTRGLFEGFSPVPAPELLQMLCRRHNTDWFKNQENPYIGHVYERAWSLLFDCHASQNASAWVDQCRECEANQYIDCPPGACQCLDEAVPASKPRTTTISIHMQNATKNGTTKYWYLLLL